MYKSGTGTSGRVFGDLGLGDARRGTSEVNASLSSWRQTTLPSLWFLRACLQSEDSAKIPCIAGLLADGILEPKQGRVGCGCQKLCRKTAFGSKKFSGISEFRIPKSVACTTKPRGIQPIFSGKPNSKSRLLTELKQFKVDFHRRVFGCEVCER